MGSKTTIAIVAGGAYLLFCLATLSHQYTFDAISYLLDVENTRLSIPVVPASIAYNFFHSQHLLFSPIVYLFYHFWMLLGYSGSAMVPAQALNLLEGSLTISLAFLILMSITDDQRLSLFCALFLGSTYSIWSNTAMVSDHMASCLIASILFGALLRTDIGKTSIARLVFLGCLNGLATLMHQANAIMGIMFLTLAAFSRVSLAARVRALAIYIVSAGATVVVPYLLVGIFILKNSTVHDFIFWAFYYAMPGVISVTGHYGTMSLGRFVDLLTSFGASVIGGFYWMNRVFEMRTLQRFGVPALSALALLISTLVMARVISLGAKKESNPQLRKARYLSISWFLIYALLLFWWWPTYYQLWAVPLVGFVIFLGTLIHSTIRQPIKNFAWLQGGFVALIAVVCSANLLAVFLPAHDIRNNDYYVTTIAIGNHTSAGDLVIIPGNDEYETYIPYFMKRNVASLHEILIDHMNDLQETLDDLRDRMSETWDSSHNVYIVDELRDSARSYADVYSLHHLKNDDIAHFFRHYPTGEAIETQSLTLYELKPSDSSK